MKEKLLQFFTGKMGKSVYISTVAAVICGAVVITSTVIVHNNNQKIDAVLESLSASESVTESDTESTTEAVSENQTKTEATNNEPSGDKALQYIAEYDRLTKEYEAKRAELEKQIIYVAEPLKPKTQDIMRNPNISDEEYQQEKERVKKENESRMAVYESECASVEAVNQHTKEVEKQIDALDTQYQKDVTDLKARYGIS